MNLLNLIEVETPRGYRTYELHHGDITRLDLKVDVLAISAFKDNFHPAPRTVIGALHEKDGENRKPASIAQADMALCLYCPRRLLDFRVEFRERAPDRP